MRSSAFASRSVGRHYARGVVGLLALLAGVAGAAAGIAGAITLLLVTLVTLVAWRGCPTCWAIGLMHTRDACADGHCRTADPLI